jgi:hydroxybutyrate-dimer hydrolase
MMSKRTLTLTTAVAAAALAACGGGGAPTEQAQGSPGAQGNFNRLPAFVVAGSIRSTDYDGIADDLLTAGLGQSGLANPAAPGYANPLAPTAAELRRNAIHNNYRALLDMTTAGGYGTLYGPAVGVGGEGKVAGTEVLAYSDDGSGKDNVTLMVQVPAGFDAKRPCIVTAPSSGSRGVYGAISSAEWGLKRGCAVAYTDKGTGGAPHNLHNDTVPLIDGTRAPAAAAGSTAHFRAGLAGAELAAFNAATPNRFAFKHAHSQRNPEQDWGRYTLQAVEFAFWVLNERYSQGTGFGGTVAQIRPHNTLVIAQGVSNGGGAAIAAAEADTGGLIDAVVVSEPQLQMPASLPVAIERGGVVQAGAGRTLYDYVTHAGLYGGCAALSTRLAGTPFQASYAFLFGALATQRCASLKAAGLLDAAGAAAQADEALDRLVGHGWEPETVAQYATFAGFEVNSAVAVTYANAYTRARVQDHLCNYSYAATAPFFVAPLDPALLTAMFATGNGVPPSSGVQLVNNASLGGAARDLLSLSSTGVQDMNLAGARCLRGLLATPALQAGQDGARRSGDLRGKPALIVHGRDDGLLPVNHNSRAYAALNRHVEGAGSALAYIEVTNAQHFDAFIGLPTVLPGFDSRYVPLHVYFQRGLDAMWAHLTARTPLPPSQVLRTLPRGGTPGAAPPIAPANLPPFAAAPGANAITFGAGTLRVPD